MEFKKPRWMSKQDSQSSDLPLASDSVRVLEMKELEEEEKYLQALKAQMEKFELFRQEIMKKDQKIEELQNLVKEMTQNASKLKSVEVQNSNLVSALEAKEKENFELRQKVRKQVEEYESSLKEVQMIVLKEREEKNNEIRALKRKVAEGGADSSKMKIAELEKNLINEQKALKDKERAYMENLKNWKNLEKVLKDQVAELSNEKTYAQDKLEELTEENSALFNKIEEITKQNEKLVKNVANIDKISEVLKDYKKAKEELATAELKQKELLSYTNKYKTENIELQTEIENLHEELTKAIEIVKRQEQTILDLRSKNQEFDLNIEDLQDENIELKRQVQVLKISMNEKCLAHEALLEKCSNQEKKINAMDVYLKTFMEKENHEKLEREKKAKKKIELFTQRTAEVNKLAEVLESFTHETNYSFD